MPAGKSRKGNQDDNSNLDPTEILINKVCANFSEQIESKMNESFEKFDKKLNEMSNSIKAMNKDISNNNKSISKIEEKCELLEQVTKRNSLRILGVGEQENEDVVDTVVKFVNNLLKVPCDKEDIDCAFRVGKSLNENGKSRAILVNFLRNIKRNEIFNTKKQLKNSEFAIFEDLTPRRYELLLAAKKKFGKNMAWSSGGKIYIWNERDKKKQLLNAISDL